MRAAVVLLALLATSAASDFYLCEVVVPDFCAKPIDLKRQTSSCAPTPSITLQGDDYDITTGFNVVAFGTLNANADTEGRMLVGGDATLSTGYSIGEKVYTKGPGAVDSTYPYSGVFGGKLTWPSGSLNPDGSDFYSASYAEKMYVAGKFTGSDDLAARKTSNTESISDDMTAAQSYYTQVQAALDAMPDTNGISYAVNDAHTMVFTCPSGASSYNIHVPSSAFDGVSSYAFSGCSANVQMVITVTVADAVSTISFTSGAINPSDRDAARTVFNILGSGKTIKFTSTRFYGIILSPNNNYAVDTNAPGATDGIVIVNNVLSAGQFNRINCTTPAVVGEPTPCVSFETVCDGTLFTAPNSAIQGDTRDYNVISFNNFKANTGDIEGRLMVRNNFVVGNGYSIGYMLQTANNLGDRQEAYALLAGGDCTWGDGSIHPDGSGIPYAGNAENIYCGKSFTGPANLLAKNLGGCATEGCLNSIFDAAYTCYAGYSATLATKTANVAVEVSQSNMMFTCNSATATNYVVNVNSAMLPQATYFTTSNCNYQAYWTINIVGSGDVLLSGGSMPTPSGSVVYNVIGQRTIFVDNTAVNGHILAPNAVLNQTGGVILGKVVVGDIVMSLQINREDVCTEVTDVPVPIQSPPATTGNTPNTPNTPATGTPSQSTGNTPSTPNSPNSPSEPQQPVCISTDNTALTLNAPVYGPAFANDTTVVGVTADGCPVVTPGPLTLIAPGARLGTVVVPSNAGGKVPVINTNGNSNTSSASVAAASMVVFAIALLF